MADRAPIAQPPTRVQQAFDLFFRKLCQTFAFLSALFVVVIVLTIATAATPAMKQYGLQFLAGTTWDPNRDQFAVLPEIWGTWVS
jgi:phosphate transport system permease protein